MSDPVDGTPAPVPAAPTPATGQRRPAPWPETKVLAAVLAGILALLILEIIVSRWRGESARVERAPEHELDYRLDVNQATLGELVHLPGIGPALAERILADRAENGPFRNLDDLGRVRGIGAVKLADMAPYLVWPDQAAAPIAPAPSATLRAQGAAVDPEPNQEEKPPRKVRKAKKSP